MGDKTNPDATVYLNSINLFLESFSEIMNPTAKPPEPTTTNPPPVKKQPVKKQTSNTNEETVNTNTQSEPSSDNGMNPPKTTANTNTNGNGNLAQTNNMEIIPSSTMFEFTTENNENLNNMKYTDDENEDDNDEHDGKTSEKKKKSDRSSDDQKRKYAKQHTKWDKVDDCKITIKNPGAKSTAEHKCNKSDSIDKTDASTDFVGNVITTTSNGWKKNITENPTNDGIKLGKKPKDTTVRIAKP
jgi:hypothetical protein